MAIRKAQKQQAKLRLALCGPTGSGKTYTALAIATALGGKVGVIDTERNSACLYSDKFEFDVEADMHAFAPGAYVEKIREFAKLGYDVLVIDSLSHAWSGEGGALQMVDEAAKRSRGSGNSFAAWREVTPEHNKMVEAILAFPGHLVATMRSKMEYVLEEGPNGKKIPRKIGMAPIQRDGLEYEFTVVGDMDTDHNLIVTKSRCSALADKVIKKPGAEVAETLLHWLNQGEAAPERPSVPDDAEQFAIHIAECFQARDFTDEDAQLAREAVLQKKYHVKAMADLNAGQRQEFVDAILTGKLDKYRLASLAGK